ncbi:hypothetical protein [Thalassolituus sp. UBA3500]|uniref:hypothetical protein n=1 Tax=Thalassolituus sp. UBA3500 TaxID=1947664 RepID=UPI0007CFCC4C|nr:hypothetical protein [Thalassolituus sp. UBA3500]KZY97646.1 hypothetical protein A3746_08545 [Oleibacter sp. HI0075]MBN59427.1 hypothetical protein [Oceanospirillaceae bacterium]|tara:strand:- start:7310 stop:7786 length:477 start_codon:yes stop_codon:yes gene_type:complete
MPSPSLKLRLGQLLLNRRAITRKQLDDALQYQKEHAGAKLGEALIALGAIDEGVLKRVLRQQRWLRPCATCFALLSPMSVTYAYDPEEHMLSAQDEAATYWYLQEEEQQSYSDSEQAMRVLSTAYDLYKGEPEAGEWRYSLSETDSSKGYQVEVKVFF